METDRTRAATVLIAEDMSNAEYYANIQAKALSSFYWLQSLAVWLPLSARYAPEVSAALFAENFAPGEPIGTQDIEKKTGRRLSIEELEPVPRSVPYFLTAYPNITGTEDERERLCEFDELITSAIRKMENRTRAAIRKRLQAEYEARMNADK